MDKPPSCPSLSTQNQPVYQDSSILNDDDEIPFFRIQQARQRLQLLSLKDPQAAPEMATA